LRDFRARVPGVPLASSNPVAFALFLLLNAVLFVRPSEIFPELATLPIYQIVILTCLTASLPTLLLRVLALRGLVQQPITLCVLGLLVLVGESLLGRLTLEDAYESFYSFAKIVVYYLLLLCNVNTPGRIKQFLGWLVVFIAVLTGLAVLQWHGYLEIPGLTMARETWFDKDLGLDTYLYRLQSLGIFNDPNDLCLVLTLAMVVCVYQFGDRPLGLVRVLWLTPIALFGYALILTQSRGGFLGMVVGLLALFHSRYGWKKTLCLSVVVLPPLLLVFGGRQTDIDLSNKGDTAQARIHLWSEGLDCFKQSPLRGIGADQYAEKVGQVAHNSFVHAFVELGFFGGVLFTGAFYLALWSLYRVGSPGTHISNFEMRRLRPYLWAIVAAYAGGMWSLSRCYVVPTYMVLGLASVYIPAAGVRPPLTMLHLSPKLALRLLAVGFVTLVGIYLFVRLFARF
jgi:O-antigen ligase